MTTFSALLELTGQFLSQRPVTWSIDVFFDLLLNKRLGKQSRRWWFETPSGSLWRHCNVRMITPIKDNPVHCSIHASPHFNHTTVGLVCTRSWTWPNTVYPKKYAHGFCFAVLCCGYTLTDFPISIRLTSLALWQSNDCPSASKATLMNMDKYFMWIHYERLHNHNKAKHNKTVCIFLGIYCMIITASGDVLAYAFFKVSMITDNCEYVPGGLLDDIILNGRWYLTASHDECWCFSGYVRILAYLVSLICCFSYFDYPL